MSFLSTEIVNDKGRYRSRLRGRRSIWDFGMNNVSVGDSEVAQTAFRELSRDVLSGRRPDDNVLKCPSAVVRVVIDSRLGVVRLQGGGEGADDLLGIAPKPAERILHVLRDEI